MDWLQVIIILIGSALCIISFSVGEVRFRNILYNISWFYFGFFYLEFSERLNILGRCWGIYLRSSSCLDCNITNHKTSRNICLGNILSFLLADHGYIAAIFRRSLKRGSINQADHMHFHQLMMRVVVIYSGGRISQNQPTLYQQIIILPFCILIAFLGILFLESNFFSMLTIIFATFIFFGSYYLLIFSVRSKAFRKFIKN